MADNRKILDILCNEVLSHIEVREAKSLNWGFIQGTQPLDWLDGELDNILDNLSPRQKNLISQIPKPSVETIIKNLEDRKLLFGSKDKYRSRFAETIRLLYLLRQRFSDDDWQTGSRLVGDMKIFLKKRGFPDWVLGVDQVLEQLPPTTSLQKEVVRTLVGEDKLAKFQSDSIRQILLSLQQDMDSAIVIGAGTGSGKTRAFYTPALAFLSQNKDDTQDVQAIALYPRVELLKDQLREAYQEIRKLDGILSDFGSSSLRIGAYYNGVPRSASDFDRPDLMSQRNWHRTTEDHGWKCPYMVCPSCGKGILFWSDEHIRLEQKQNDRGIYGQNEILECLSCGETITGKLLPLTREHLLKSPPDILFTTTETLNRRLGDSAEHHLFGIGVKNPPRLLLMDEIHLNEGFHGAQVGYLLRRWRYARGKKSSVCIVGLSATLTKADHFFARLTGIDNVSYITPSDDDIVQEGMEYNVVLKGDPVAGTTLLSTSVRTVMLLGRTLDSLNDEPISRGTWGQRIFAFSDKLDSINRWYHILKEVENPRQPYAEWRLLDPKKVSREIWDTRNKAGQNWWITNQVKPGSLSTSLLLDLTSSQYRGVNPNADIVIASSTLEVGYNDPNVGAVIQHKSPYGQASFLQRKGRAGRPRDMRPWMIVVTSNYGRDRWMFQHAESMFDPLLPSMDLPLENYYVSKVQAVYALIDWLSQKLKTDGYLVNIWTLLSSETSYQQSKSHSQLRNRVCNILSELTEDKRLLGDFVAYIKHALEIKEEYIVQLLLWGKPRSLMLDVIPTLLRQLKTDWQSINWNENQTSLEVTKWNDNILDIPLPDFLPPTLFSDLNLPEVTVKIPKRPTHKEDELSIKAKENLNLSLAMSEFTPGKVNKRFADKDRTSESHWIYIPENQSGNDIVDLFDLAIKYETVPTKIQVSGEAIDVYRPQIFNIWFVPSHIRPTSNAFHKWNSHFLPRDRRYDLSDTPEESLGQVLSIAQENTLNAIFKEIRSYTHNDGIWTEVTRFADSTEVYTRYDHGGEKRRLISYHCNGEKSAMGFTIDVDAIFFSVSDLNFEEIKSRDNWRKIYPTIAVQFLRYKLQNTLTNLTTFEINWIWQISTAMIFERAITLKTSMSNAAEEVYNDIEKCAYRVLQTQVVSGVYTDEDISSEHENHYLIDNLLQLFRESSITSAIWKNVHILWDDSDPELENFLQHYYLESLGAATFASIVNMFPDVEADDLHLDIKAEGFWISELTAGGVGLISRIIDEIPVAPHSFSSFLRNSINFCEREFLSEQLKQVAKIVDDVKLSKSFESIRNTTSLPRVENLQRELSRTLNNLNIKPNRNLIVALNTRFLRPNSSLETDQLIHNLVDFWDSENARLGVDIDMNTIALATVQHIEIREAIIRLLRSMSSSDIEISDSQIYSLIQSFLWMDCKDSCPDCIQKNHRFADMNHASRHTLINLMNLQSESIDFGDENWQDQAYLTLIENRQVIIKCNTTDLSHAHKALTSLITQPIEVGYILEYASLTRLERQNNQYLFELRLSS